MNWPRSRARPFFWPCWPAPAVALTEGARPRSKRRMTGVRDITREQASSGVSRFAQPLRLDSGARLEGVEIAYQTYGALNADKSNAVLVCHALTGDQHLASPHP